MSVSRREVLFGLGAGLGTAALNALFAQDDPLSPKKATVAEAEAATKRAAKDLKAAKPAEAAKAVKSAASDDAPAPDAIAVSEEIAVSDEIAAPAVVDAKAVVTQDADDATDDSSNTKA